MRTVAAECSKHGIGGMLPTLITGSFDDLLHGFSTLRAAVEQLQLFAGEPQAAVETAHRALLEQLFDALAHGVSS